MKKHICFAQVHFIMLSLTLPRKKKKKKSSAHNILSIVPNKQKHKNRFWI